MSIKKLYTLGKNLGFRGAFIFQDKTFGIHTDSMEKYDFCTFCTDRTGFHLILAESILQNTDILSFYSDRTTPQDIQTDILYIIYHAITGTYPTKS